MNFELLDIKTFDWNIKHHYFASIWIMTHINDDLYYIMGYNAMSQALTSFGGRSNLNESCLETAIRETEEESAGSINFTNEFVQKNTNMIIRKVHLTKQGYIFNLYCKNFNFEEHENKMLNLLRTEYRNDYMENSHIVAVPVNNIYQKLNHENKLLVNDIKNRKYNVKTNMISTLRFIKNHIKL